MGPGATFWLCVDVVSSSWRSLTLLGIGNAAAAVSPNIGRTTLLSWKPILKRNQFYDPNNLIS
jgi:hypothetical protein